MASTVREAPTRDKAHPMYDIRRRAFAFVELIYNL